jgi:hypothetical protein
MSMGGWRRARSLDEAFRALAATRSGPGMRPQTVCLKTQKAPYRRPDTQTRVSEAAQWPFSVFTVYFLYTHSLSYAHDCND